MEVTAITRRRHPILTSFISQVTPSESSVIRRVAMEPVFQHYLKSVLSIRGVKRVAMHEPLTSLYAVIAIQFARGAPESEIWRALHGAASLHRFAGKWIIAVDEDIEPENADALLWAMSYRCQPQYDLKLVPHKDPGHGPRGPHDGGETAAVLINATLKGTFAPVALPKREFMENAKAIWERLGPLARYCWRAPIRDYRPRMKEVLKLQGLIAHATVRAPQLGVDAAERAEIARLARAAGLLDTPPLRAVGD